MTLKSFFPSIGSLKLSLVFSSFTTTFLSRAAFFRYFCFQIITHHTNRKNFVTPPPQFHWYLIFFIGLLWITSSMVWLRISFEDAIYQKRRTFFIFSVQKKLAIFHLDFLFKAAAAFFIWRQQKRTYNVITSGWCPH